MNLKYFAVMALGLAAGLSPFPTSAQGGAAVPPSQPVTRMTGRSPAAASPVLPAEAVPPVPMRGDPAQGGARPAPVPVTQLDHRAPGADLDAPRSVSLSVSRPVSVRSLLLLLVRGTGFSVVLGERVSGSFSGALKGLTMRQALEAVLFPRGLDYDVRGTVIRVFPHTPVTRLFDVSHAHVRRSAAEAGAPDLFREVEEGVAALLSASGRVHVNRIAGLVQVTDFTERLDRVAVYLEAVELRASRQVRIDARIFAFVSRDPSVPFVDWTAIAARPGSGVRAGAGRAGAGLRVDDFAALMRAIGEQGTVRMIAAPRFFAANNEPAIVEVGAEITRDEPRFPALAPDAPALAHVLQDLALRVTAQVGGDEVVQLHVAPAYAEDGRHLAASGRDLSVRQVTEADTRVRVRSGDTVVLSGLLQERIKDAGPAAAAARSDLVVLLTPTIVVPAAASQR